MKNVDFYKLLTTELDAIVSERMDGKLLAKLKQDEQKRAYALLIWFLSFYSEVANIETYITDGNDDSSCDIILDLTDNQGVKTFYLIQSKWNSESNCCGELDSTELKSFLSDVQVVMRGEKSGTKNSRFNARYKALLQHIKQNGSVKAIFLCLKNRCTTTSDNITATKNSIGGRLDIEIFDINRIKCDFISRRHKGSLPPNPLNSVYSPEYEKIKLSVVRDDPASRNQIFVRSPFEAHIFFIKPSMIFTLVDRYGVSLFEKNVRNPLQRSSINTEIESTLKNNPSYFWYYNNGITAITRSIPEISQQAEEFEVIGLQIINGAQTAYSIFKALQSCSPEQRALIDAEARITFRLLKSGGKDFDLKVTKYTNSQNPVSDRDFWSNDPVQEKVQEYFYNTNHWYERRAGEFKNPPKQVFIIPNTYVASAHLAFWLGDPVGVFDAAMKRESKKIDLIFTSFKENENGLYEKIFNKDTESKSVFASFCMFDILTDGDGFEIPTVFFTNGFHILAVAKVILKKYIKAKFGDSVDMAEFIIKRHNTEKDELLSQIITHASIIIRQEVKADMPQKERRQALVNLMTKRGYFDMLLEKIESSPLTPEMIESIKLKGSIEDLDRLEDDEIEQIDIAQST